MDLVEEQDGLARRRWRGARGPPAITPRTSTTPLITADSVSKWAPDLVGEESREARLAGARRAPQQDRGEMAAVDTLLERSPLADEMLLADELVERPRPHPRGERLGARRRLEQARLLGSRATRRCPGHRADGTRAGAPLLTRRRRTAGIAPRARPTLERNDVDDLDEEPEDASGRRTGRHRRRRCGGRRARRRRIPRPRERRAGSTAGRCGRAAGPAPGDLGRRGAPRAGSPTVNDDVIGRGTSRRTGGVCRRRPRRHEPTRSAVAAPVASGRGAPRHVIASPSSWSSLRAGVWTRPLGRRRQRIASRSVRPDDGG